MNDNDVDDMEVGRCSCGLVFYSIDYALSHVCLGGDEDTEGHLSLHTPNDLLP